MAKKILRIAGKVLLYFLGFSIFLVLIYRFVPPPVTYLMVQRNVEQLINHEPLRLKKDWVSSEKISNNLKQAVIASEDQLFLEHDGFDFKAIEKAYTKNKKGKRIKGASTISQQCAKNVFLWPQRTWIRKGFEVYFTFLIELFWNKERIMEVYLNEIEMGNGIYGAEAAAQTYFKKSAAQLSKGEAAFIAAALPNPLRWNPSKPNAYLLKRQAWILKNMDRLGPLDF